ncbi:uncharacterized protein LOC113236015 isoform X2 [Hyposmocoma kahamanoa]|uniref:uncharacterized protein LOC113236015 isoform X2 n=1 Tax=Hyposmocoma kahamanoa TaxID=1477025 RepID=UPI000E6D822C|nr:uncharacterized protein LOC113236015 isoform X2 [Hyposmocoma kahamanoa]
MSEKENLDIEQELDELLTKVQPDLQNVIKRSFTNVALQQTKNGEQIKPAFLEDTSYFAKNTQVNLSKLELVRSPTFHMQSLSLDLKSMSLSLKCSLGEVNVKGIYSAFNENLYNLIPVMSEGHVLISLSNVTADVNVGLVLKDDAFSFINPEMEFLHDEVVVKLSWPSPQKNGGYKFITTEQLAKHIDDLPLTAAISLPLYALLRQKLQHHLVQVLRQATSVSEVMCCNPSLMEAYSDMVNCLAENGNKVIDMILINMRRTLLQTRREVLELPPVHATFMHKIGSISFIGKFETDTGWVKNLATINRINDVSVTRPDPMKTSFHVTLKIKDLQIGYDDYRIKAMGTSCTGRLVASFNSNALHLALTIGLARWEPYAQLDDLRLQHCEVLTWACCAFVLMLLMFGIIIMMVYGISVGYHYAQKELAAFAMSSRTTTETHSLLRSMKDPEQPNLAPVVRLVAVNRSQMTHAAVPMLGYMDMATL